jgi:hypothetical protein
MIVSSAKTLLKAYGFDDNDPLLDWLQAAKEEIFSSDSWPFLMKVGTVNINANVATISALLPADLEKVSTIRNATASPNVKLRYVDPVSFDRDYEDWTAQGDPEVYTVRASVAGPGWEVQVWPVPTVATSYRFSYQASSVDITTSIDAGTMPGPTAFHYPIVQKAASIGLQADSEEDRASTAKDEADTAIARLRRKMFSGLDESDTVADVMGYGG